MRIGFVIISLLLLVFSSHAQMWNGQDTLYGNEWIEAQNNPIYKFSINQDGLYRVSYEALKASGFPVDNVSAKNFRLFKNGKEVAIYISRDGILSGSDFIEFYGYQNRDDLDQYLLPDPDNQLLNRNKSLYGNFSSYFLTWSTNESDKRVDLIENNLENLPAPEPFFMAKITKNYTNTLVKNQGLQAGVFWSNYEESEGFCQGFKISYQEDFAPSRVFTDYPVDGTLDLRMGFNFQTVQSHRITLNERTILDTNLIGSNVRQFKFNVPNADIRATTELSIDRNEGNLGRFTLSKAVLSYARKFDFANRRLFKFDLVASTDRRYFEVARFRENEDGNNLLIDIENNIRLVPTQDGNTTKFTLPPGNAGELVLLDENEILQITALEEIQKFDFQTLDNEYIILSNDRLYVDTLNGNQNWVAKYAEYRSSLAGGQFGVTILNVNDLYNYFGYGLNNHPMAIRNFAHWANKNWTKIKFVNILGKGLEYSVVNSIGNDLNYIPTWGVNGADNLLFASHESNVPMFAVGRVPASDPFEIKAYLDKVIEFEDRSISQTIEDKSWRKRFVHLSGGSSASEQASIAGYLDLMARNIENSTLGGDVESFYKNSQEAVDESQAQKLTNIINQGTAYITFFGHSSSQTFDYSINSPEEFDNEGKYFVMSAMGCNAGKIHTGANTLSERFIFAERKGAIAFLASSGLGYISAYRTYGNDHYRELGIDQVGKPIGEIVRTNLITLDRSFNTHKLLAQQMTLAGDPALQISYEEGPDYIIDESTVGFDPQLLNIELESYKLNFDIVNLGYATLDSLPVKVVIEYSDGVQEEIYNKKLASPRNRNDVTIELPAFSRKISGFTKFYITLDEENNISETPIPVAENNNELIAANGNRGIEVFLFAKETLPIFPANFGISNDPSLELKASTSNPFISDQVTVFEIDTIESFDSPVKQRYETSQRGGLVSWKPEIQFQDEKVYYWRVSPDSTDEVGYAWKNSSFVFLENQPGVWNQSHYQQYLKNDFSGLTVSQGQDFEFTTRENDLTIFNKRAQGALEVKVSYNGDPDVYRTTTVASGIAFVVVDPISGERWPNPPGGLYDSYGLAADRIFHFPYKTDTQVERAKAINFLNNIVPSGAYVGVFTLHKTSTTYNPELWAADSLFSGTNLFQVLEAQGAAQVRDLEIEGKRAYAFIYQKDIGALGELKGEREESQISLYAQLASKRPNGNMQSVVIGPATKWESVTWEAEELENSDTYNIRINGIRANGILDELFFTNANDIDISSIDPLQYESIQMDFVPEDSLNRTPVHLKNWRVVYEEIPELALNPNVSFEFRSDTLQQGDSMRIQLAVDNISTASMDSVLVAYTLRLPDNTEKYEEIRVQAIDALESIVLNYASPLGILAGPYSLTIDVNPNDDQPEKFHFNNVGVYNFFVEGDNRNPILDVTFDGVHIINGDLVSSEPIIKIELNDENKFLALKDTSIVEVGLIYPGSNTPIIQSYASNNLIFYPANENNLDRENKAVIDFLPGQLADGIYTLVLQGKDESGNVAGALSYRISFEVISSSSISNVLNYPNPFSTSTRFVYTMTGSEAPEQFKIQIMTVSGKVVREITKMDLGELRIGTHMTDYAWDGTDEYGDKLAAGVYLYRVIAKDMNGDDYEKRDVGTDTYFEKGIGKLVIMR